MVPHSIIRREFMKPAETMTGPVCSARLERVDARIRHEQSNLATRRNVSLLHDDARPHILALALAGSELESFIAPIDSPDLTPSDYHLSLYLQNTLNNHTFTNKREIKNNKIAQEKNSIKDNIFAAQRMEDMCKCRGWLYVLMNKVC